MDQQLIDNITRVLIDMLAELKVSETQNKEEEDFNEEFIRILETAIANPNEETLQQAMTMVSIYSQTHEQMAFAESLKALSHAELSDLALKSIEESTATDTASDVTNNTTPETTSTLDTITDAPTTDQSQIDQLRQQLASLAK